MRLGRKAFLSKHLFSFGDRKKKVRGESKWLKQHRQQISIVNIERFSTTHSIIFCRVCFCVGACWRMLYVYRGYTSRQSVCFRGSFFVFCFSIKSHSC